MIKDDKHAQRVEAELLKQACNGSMNRELIPVEIALPTEVARQLTFPEMLETAVLGTCDGADVEYNVCGHTSNLNGGKVTLLQ